MVTAMARTIVKLRLAILLLFALLLLAAAFYVPQFRINASADTLLVKNNALYIKTQQANQRFSPDEFILVAYQPHNGEVFSAATFADLQLLAGQYQQLERVRSVSSILTVPLITDASALTGDTDITTLNWLQQRYAPQTMQQLLADHPLYTDLLLNKSQTAAALQIVFNTDTELAQLEQQMLQLQSHTLQRELTSDETRALQRLQRRADPLRQALSKKRQQEIQQINKINQRVTDRATTYMGGAYVVGQHLIAIIKNDLITFGIAIVIIIALLLLLLYRRLRWVTFPLLACAASVWLTLGLFAAFDLRATVISANFIALQLILTLAVMIHLITSYRDVARDQPAVNQQQRVVAMLEQKLAPCFYATLTTSVGFASLMFSGIQPVVDFGLMMLLAMLLTMSVSLLLFPALLCLLNAEAETADYSILQRLLVAIRRAVAGAPLRTTAIATVMFLLLCPGLFRLNVENSFIHYFTTNTRVHQELQFIDQHFGGSTPLDIIITAAPRATKPDLLLSAEQVNRLHMVHAAIAAFDATGNVTSVLNFTRLARKINDDKPLTEYELTTIYQLLDKQVAAQLVGAYLAKQPLQLRIASRIQDTTLGLNREQFLQQLHQDIQALGLSNTDYSLTNLFVLYQDILSRLLTSQVNTLGLVYVALALILLLIFRSVKIALIALLPNILTTLGIIGLIGWLAIPLDLMTITIAAIAMGIAIDDTIHFTHRYLQAPPGKALQDSYAHTGLAMLFTSGIIAVGFAVFGFSDFLPSVYFGLLTAAAMLMALLADLTILPALLHRFANAKPATAST